MPKRNSKRLTDPGIERMSKPPWGARVERFDSEVNGLCLRITHRGTKTWNVYFRVNRGKNQRVLIGPWIPGGEPYADGNGGYGVAAARRVAEKIRQQAKAGIDPREAQEREAAGAKAEEDRQDLRTFEAIAENYIAREIPKLKRGKEMEAVIRRELLSCWTGRPIDTIKKRDARDVTDRLIEAGTPAAAYRAHETMVRLFSWMIEEYDADLLGFEFSPLTGLKPPIKKVPRQRMLTHNEIRRLWPIWEDLGYPFGKAMMLLLLTGARRSEIARLSWPEVDLEQKLLKVPSARMKGGRDHVIPLSGMAVEIIEGLPHFEGPYVFTTNDGGHLPIQNFAWAKQVIEARLAKQEDQEPMPSWRTHDLRRTMRSELSRLRVPEAVSERILDHTLKGIQGVYNVYEFLDERREALERWAVEVRSIVSPSADNVVKLPLSG